MGKLAISLEVVCGCSDVDFCWVFWMRWVIFKTPFGGQLVISLEVGCVALLRMVLLIYRAFWLAWVVVGNDLKKKTSKSFPTTTVKFEFSLV